MTSRHLWLALGLSLFGGLVAWKACTIRSSGAAEVDYATFPDLHPSVLVTNPKVLVALEDGGFSLADVLGVATGSRGPRYEGQTGAELMRSPAYVDLVTMITNDLRELQGSTPSVGVGVPFKHRLFDARWFRSPRVHYELVGLANRMDLRAPDGPGCGQTRLVYRIAYDPPGRPRTRLPLTINVLYDNGGPDCAALARRWLALEDGLDPTARLRAGPLANVSLGSFARLEVNLQSLREDSQGKKMDDHGEYILRSFVAAGGRLVPGTLRNTPRLDLDDGARAALADWIGKNVDSIDRGSASVPDDFLATRAVSFSPRGLARPVNRAYKTLFPDERGTFGDASLSGTHLATSPQMLVRRLDQMTCEGCHQSRSIAGFHLLGEERSGGPSNALTTGISEHLRQTIDWRYRSLQASAEGRRLSEPEPLPEHGDDAGVFGAHCTHAEGAPDYPAADGLPDWTCAPGLVCRPSDVVGDPIGVCVGPLPHHAGDPCQHVELALGLEHDGDTVSPERPDVCGPPQQRGAPREPTHCNPNQDGFPGGMCTTTCEHEGERKDGSICMRIPHKGFEAGCFKKGVTLEQCLQVPGNFAIELMKTCSRTEPCRDDFVCSRVGGLPLDQGACVPPYFIFQARVDGPPIDR